MGVTELMFVDTGVKVNGHYYHNVLLSQQMTPAIKQVAGNNYYNRTPTIQVIVEDVVTQIFLKHGVITVCKLSPEE